MTRLKFRDSNYKSKINLMPEMLGLGLLENYPWGMVFGIGFRLMVTCIKLFSYQEILSDC